MAVLSVLIALYASSAAATWNTVRPHGASTLEAHSVDANGIARKSSFHLMAIAMPDAFESADRFVRSLVASAETDIAEGVPGVNRDLLNIEKLQSERKVCMNYTLSGDISKTHNINAEVATTYAHRNAAKRFLEGDADFAIIFEDDVEMSLKQKDLNEIAQKENATFLEAMERVIASAPEDFDEINLGRCRCYCHKQHLIVST